MSEASCHTVGASRPYLVWMKPLDAVFAFRKENAIFLYSKFCQTVDEELLHALLILEFFLRSILDDGPLPYLREDVGFVERNVRDAVYPYRFFKEVHVHPIHLTRTARSRAELLAQNAYLLEDWVSGFELFCTDISFIHLGNTPYFADRRGWYAIQEEASGGAVRRGHIGVITPVDVEAEALGAFAQDSDFLLRVELFVEINEIRLQFRYIFRTHADTGRSRGAWCRASVRSHLRLCASR